MNHSIGSTFYNDIQQLHHTKTSRQYFEDFKNYLRKSNPSYEIPNYTPAQIVLINGKAVYYVGSTVWWGISVSAVNKCLENTHTPVYVILYASDKGQKQEHYWLIEINQELNGKRVVFTENNGKLSASSEKDKVNIPGCSEDLNKILKIITGDNSI
ncbi:MAG: hypothetical protein IJ642_09810 [Oscillospiraceae bacterium]|nr:hypothetical protein [Oscillospiraceae bacterium]